MNNDKPSSESSPSPTDTQNYICLNCKLVLNHEPKQCPECKHQFFHKTYASPTEQPGVSSFSEGRFHTKDLFEMILSFKRLEAKGFNPSMQAIIDKVFSAREEFKQILAKQAELVAEMNRMKHYNLDAKREMASLNETIITLEAELEQLRSERDKMREENQKLREVLESIRDKSEELCGMTAQEIHELSKSALL